MAGNLRLILLLSQTFQWSHTRIAAYLHAEGENISASDVKQLLVKAYHALEDALPEDIRDIYLAQTAVTAWGKDYANIESHHLSNYFQNIQPKGYWRRDWFLPAIAQSSVLQTALAGLDASLNDELDRYRHWQDNGQTISYLNPFRPRAVSTQSIWTSPSLSDALSPIAPITESTPNDRRTIQMPVMPRWAQDYQQIHQLIFLIFQQPSYITLKG